jgi:MFS family permease
MGFTTAWKRLSPTQLNIAIQAFALISIFFEGYDQGVMGGVNASPNYVTEVKIGLPNGTVTNTTKQGGIVSIVSWDTVLYSMKTKTESWPFFKYYSGAIVGCFIGGWAADRIGRINGLFYAAIFALVGGALQAATQGSDFILVARVVTGLGTGGKLSPFLNHQTHY